MPIFNHSILLITKFANFICQEITISSLLLTLFFIKLAAVVVSVAELSCGGEMPGL